MIEGLKIHLIFTDSAITQFGLKEAGLDYREEMTYLDLREEIKNKFQSSPATKWQIIWSS